MKVPFSIVVLLLVTTVQVFGQGGDNGQDMERERVYSETNRRARENEQVQRPPSGLPKLKTKLSAEDKLKLSPSQEDLLEYAEFLKKGKTGIVKILAFTDCDSKVIKINDTKCLEVPQIIGYGSSYSFSAKSHVEFLSFDIRYFGDKFVAAQKGVFTDLGDVSLETFDFKEDVKNLEKSPFFKNTSRGYRYWDLAESEKFAKGVIIGGRFYQSRIPVKTNTTYLFRSDKHRLPKRIFALRVVRQDEDGNVVIIWREL